MQDDQQIQRLQQATVYSSDGDKIGRVSQVYLDDQTDRPSFVTVRTGLFGMKETFIPVAEASPTEDGVQVPFPKDFVTDAPNIDADGTLTPEEEERIHDYYTVDHTRGAQQSPTTARDDAADVRAGVAAGNATAAGGVGALGVQRGKQPDTAANLEEDVNTGTVGGADTTRGAHRHRLRRFAASSVHTDDTEGGGPDLARP